MTARAQRMSEWNGRRVLTLEGGSAVLAPPAPIERAVTTRLAVIGTEATIRQVAAGLHGVEGVVVAGAITICDSQRASPATSSSGVPVLGEAADLPLLIGRYGIKMALVCLPARMSEERRRISADLRRCEVAERVVAAIEDVVSGEVQEGQTALVPPPALLRSATSPAGAGEGGGAHRFTGAAPSIDLAALIGRTPYEMDRPAISAILRGKCVMITGGGGSIGSELAKVAAAFEPSLLVLMERSENALFEIDRQIGRHFPRVARKPVLHDVVDAEATLRLCEKWRPQVVFHAAAHKHVPLMEDHPAHAVTNNLFGTKSIADAAVAVGAERFVMISSDKAVNPTSVMGGTKRLAEMYVRGLGEKTNGQTAKGLNCQIEGSGTRLSMVRFGNVLGSAASVLTIWAQQIAEGGPITITDPRMTRYFMTIPEAATLVVQSATLDAASELDTRDQTPEARSNVGVYVLDMGEPVRIVDLAQRFVRAHGMTPQLRGIGLPADARDAGSRGRSGRLVAGAVGGSASGEAPPQTETWAGRPMPQEPMPLAQTIDLVCTGIRPGEKLHEELAYAAEQLRPTAHPGIRAWAGPGFGTDVAERMREMVDDLNAARFSQDPERVVASIRRHVPEMRFGQSGVMESPKQAGVPHVG